MNTSPAAHKALILLQNHPDRFASQGSVVATWRTYRNRRLGPYHRLTWRENGRQRSLYLGQHSPLVEEVRRLLHQAQTFRRIRREARHNAALFRKNVIRPIRQYVKEMFRLFGNGLYIKGSEIRGIKTAGPRLTAADVPPHLIPKFPLPLPSFLTEPTPQPHTDPNRKRGQETPSPHTDPNRKRGQETPSPHTDPKRERGQKTPSPKSPQHHRTPEFSKSVDQTPSRRSAVNHARSTPHHHTPEFPTSVDQ